MSAILSDWLSQRLDRNADQPLYRQLHGLLQQAILTHALAAGARMPSSRLLARELGLGRNTVIQVYEQLTLEGYVTCSTGRGTFVVDTSPDEMVGGTAHVLRDASATKDERAVPRPLQTRTLPLSNRGHALVEGAGVSKRQWGAFMPGVPDVSRFPVRVWTRLHNTHWRRPRLDLMTYAPGGGLPALRQSLADYLRTSRSVRCAPEQIILTTGIHQSIDLAVRLLSDPGDTIWTEDPCYWGIRSVLQISGLRVRPIAVDAEGMAPSSDDLKHPPKLVLVTPSHQYPLGCVMSLARRRTLLEFAQRHGTWIIEDDYDSEFRYSSRPLASLQGLDETGQVIYVGSFGKTLFPGLRVGYIVVPESMADNFAVASAELYREGQLIQQAVLAEFIAAGHFTSHVRKMRALYASRRKVLLDAMHAEYGNQFAVAGGDAGLHLVMQLPDDVDDTRVAARALERGIVARPLSSYYSNRASARSGLLLGYACVPDEEIGPCFQTLANAIDSVCGGVR
ncbi:PLP-dependent aminotransferase family protein [Pararobbsia silviterrae]|uniref:MocR-like pyridoxine biosynthesis transcription factor PdxR n=1 Tax=Pararobbsia silviterrae TaxID=1792498 RepID=UPI00268F8FB2